MAGGTRVLYVDDEPGLLEIARAFLERSGDFTVFVATSAEEALARTDIQTMDAIVSDYQMPSMDGIAFLKAVREQFGSIPYILFTGRGHEEVVIEAINNGVDFYVQKGGDPKVQFAELAHKIRQAVSKRLAERQLHDSERRLNDFINFLPDPTFAIDRTGTVIAWNRAMEEITGVAPSEMLLKGDYEYAIPFYGARHPLLIDLVNTPHLEDAIRCTCFERQGDAITAEIELVLPDGRQIAALIKAGPLSNQDGEKVGAIESIRDITDRKEQQAAIAWNREYLDQIFSSVQAGIVIIDASTHQIVDINPTGAAMIGLPKEQIVGGRCNEFICHGGGGVCPIMDLHQTVENDERLLRTGDGGVVPVIMHATLMTLDGREFVLGTFIDNRGRRQAEDAMRESETRYASIFRYNPIALTLVSVVDGTFVDVNETFTQNTGYTREEVIGRTSESLGFFPDRDSYERLIACLEERRAVRGMEIRCRIRSGAIQTCRFSSTVIMLNHRPHILTTIEDVTDQRLTEEALRESEEKFHRLADNAPDMIYRMILPEGRYEYVSPASVAMTGFSPREFYDDPALFQRLVHPDSKDYVTEQWGLLMDGSVPPYYEYRVLDRAGRTRWFNQRNMPVRDKDGRIRAIEGIVTDVTQQKENEIQLLRSERRALAVTMHAGTWIWEVDQDGLYRYSSPVIEQILGYDPVELVGKKYFYDLFDTGEREGLRSEALELLGKKRPFKNFINTLRHQDGRTAVMSTSGTPFFDEEGVFQGYYGIDEDITERRRAEEALRQVNRKLNMLSGITRHDIKNQLLALHGYVSLLQKAPSEQSFEQYISRITASCNQISKMIQFTKEYEEIGVREPTWHRVRTLVYQAAQDAGNPSVPVENEIPDDLEVYADPLIIKVFFNLVDNAMRHGHAFTGVWFSTGVHDGHLVIVCEDDGEGIAPGEKQRIFDWGVGKNTGFGLAISREILDITGISMRETGEGGTGARFEMDVPPASFRRTPTPDERS